MSDNMASDKADADTSLELPREPDVIKAKDVLGDELLVKGKDGTMGSAAISMLEGKTVGILFSASWCPACTAFTPELKKTQEMIISQEKSFEVVLVCFDDVVEKFDAYVAKADWPSTPFNHAAARAAAKALGVNSLPTLVMLDPDGKVLTRNARSAVSKSPEQFPWEGYVEPKPDDWQVAMTGFKIAGIFLGGVSVTLWGCYKAARLSWWLVHGLVRRGDAAAPWWGKLVLPVLAPLLGYTLWGVGSLLWKVIPVVMKEIKSANESSKDPEPEAEKDVHGDAAGCKDGVCPMPPKAKTSEKHDDQAACKDGVCALPPQKRQEA